MKRTKSIFQLNFWREYAENVQNALNHLTTVLQPQFPIFSSRTSHSKYLAFVCLYDFVRIAELICIAWIRLYCSKFNQLMAVFPIEKSAFMFSLNSIWIFSEFDTLLYIAQFNCLYCIWKLGKISDYFRNLRPNSSIKFHGSHKHVSSIFKCTTCFFIAS